MDVKGQLFNELFPALRRLDNLLQKGVDAAQAVYGPEVADDHYRGLHISKSEVERLLNREPGRPFLWRDGEVGESFLSDNNESRFAWLKNTFELSSFELDLIIIALAPEIDLRYERLYAYLQDDVTRRKPTVDLALNLLCSSADEKLARRAYFNSDAPLIRHRLMHLVPDPHQPTPPLLANFLRIDEQIIRLFLFQKGLDSRLISYCEIISPTISMNDLIIADELKRALPSILSQAHEERRPIRFYFHGPGGAGKKKTAEAVAAEIGMSLLVADLARAVAGEANFERFLQVLFREAWLNDAILYLDGLDTLRSEDKTIPFLLLLKNLTGYSGITILAGTRPWAPASSAPPGVMPVSFVFANFAQRRACWNANLKQQGASLNDEDLDALADRFQITSHQVVDAVVCAKNRAIWHAAADSTSRLPVRTNFKPTVNDLFAAARAQSGSEIAAFAQKIVPKYRWEDIVLPEDALSQLREICQRVAFRHRVMHEWGFDRKLSLGKGVSALFAGTSGTGKTMAAEVVANDLGLDLYKIDLSGVVSKYIGETEKNLDRIFNAAECANAILFFDEADALFGKRSEVKDAHDRYANIEISYLLQKMEEFKGIVILATNLRGNMDEAFVRRLQAIIEFPFPDEEHRERIWRSIFPPELPLNRDIDFSFLAGRLKITGGTIKNIAITSAFYAAERRESLAMKNIVRAIRREMQKIGRICTKAELGDYYELTGR